MSTASLDVAALLAAFLTTVPRSPSTVDLLATSGATLAASCGLATSFGLQAFVNMASALRLIPTKGMTLPFISYGGSSMVSLAYGVGMMLALTRQRPRTEMESIGDANANAVQSYA